MAFQYEKAKSLSRGKPIGTVTVAEIAVTHAEYVRAGWTSVLCVFEDRLQVTVAAPNKEENVRIVVPTFLEILTGQGVFDPQVHLAPI
jgi:hypothetical protein